MNDGPKLSELMTTVRPKKEAPLKTFSSSTVRHDLTLQVNRLQDLPEGMKRELDET